MAIKDRFNARVKKIIQNKFSTRWHMTLILIVTLLSGVLFNKILFILGTESLLIRHTLVLFLSYLFFFGAIKLWLIFVKSYTHETKSSKDSLNFNLDVPNLGSNISVPQGDIPWSGAGGQFAGGGASGNLDGGGPKSSSGFDIPLGDGDGVVIVLLAAVILSILGSSIYLIYEAPDILSEAAFNALLAGGMIAPARKLYNPSWAGSVLKSSILPFLLVFLMVETLAFYCHSHYPSARTIKEVFVQANQK